jgi:alpha 1,2-mannosyltransferase
MMNRSKVTRINTYACGLCVLISLVVPIAWLSMRCVEPRLTLAPSNQHDELVKRRIWVPFAAAYAAATGSKPIRKIRRHEHLEPFEIEEARLAWKTFLQTIAATPFSAFRGRGIVISGASFQLNSAFACVKMLRQYGCELPVELWISSGRGEMPSAREAQLFLELDVEIRDADAVALTFPEMKRQVHMKQGDSKPYILKQIALLSARCRECLLLDADNIPLRNPEYLFETKEYLSTGHLLWPDLWRMPRQQADIRQIFELPFGGNVTLRDEQTVESGQMVVDKGKAWYTLVLATFIQLQTEFYDLLMREASRSEACQMRVVLTMVRL